jgi:hypothetical protein
MQAYDIKLTETGEITPYLWVHPGEERYGNIMSVQLAKKWFCQSIALRSLRN